MAFRKYSHRFGVSVLWIQLLKSATSITANLEEAISAQSKSDFYHKICISYKEAQESKVWLEIFEESEFMPANISKQLIDECIVLCKLLASTKITTKKRLA